jgi:hypothetical protein
MLGAVINSLNITYINPATAILIQLLKRLQHNLLSCGVHWTSDSSDEFIEFDGSTSVEIKIGKELLDFGLAEADLVICHGFGIFVLI